MVEDIKSSMQGPKRASHPLSITILHVWLFQVHLPNLTEGMVEKKQKGQIRKEVRGENENKQR